MSFVFLFICVSGYTYVSWVENDEVKFNKYTTLIVKFLLICSIITFIYGIYNLFDWEEYYNQRAESYYLRNKTNNLPTIFLFLKIYPYLQIILGGLTTFLYSKSKVLNMKMN
jgi:nitric oxide reductase large subunit